jgi:hypothetical protein
MWTKRHFHPSVQTWVLGPDQPLLADEPLDPEQIVAAELAFAKAQLEVAARYPRPEPDNAKTGPRYSCWHVGR